MLFKRLDRYIFVQSLYGLLIALSAIVVSIIMVDLVEQLRAVSGVESANFGTALYFTLIRLPGLIEQTTPLTILIAALLTFTGLSRRSEIIAMRAAGISAWRFLAPLGWLAIITGLVIVVFIGPLAANLNKKYEILKDNLTSNITTTGPNAITRTWTTLPIIDGQIIISGAASNNDPENLRFNNATIYQYQKDGVTFVRRIDAPLIEKNGMKIIVKNATISVAGLPKGFANEIQIPLFKESRDMTSLDARSIPIWSLPQAAEKAKLSGGSPQKFWLRFYKLIALPITMLSMALFAALMSIGLDRSGGKLISVFIGLGVGIVMFFINDLTGLLATSGRIPAIVAAFCPPIFILSATLAFFSNREDGSSFLSD